MNTGRRLEVHVLRSIRAHDTNRRAMVYCPLRQRTLSLDECLACERCSGLLRENGRAVVVCDAGSAQVKDSALPKHWRTGCTDPSTLTPVSDVMTTDPICVGRDVDVDEISEILLHECYSGAVVVDEEDRPIGVISVTDLLRELRDRDGTQVVERRASPIPEGMHELATTGATAGDVMSPVVVSVHESDTIAHAAAVMAFEGIHRLAVVGDDGRVVGILTSTDVLRWIGQRAGFLIPTSTSRRLAQA